MKRRSSKESMSTQEWVLYPDIKAVTILFNTFTLKKICNQCIITMYMYAIHYMWKTNNVLLVF